MADATDQMGRTPLHYAALEGSAEKVGALLGEGADVHAADAQGFTALHCTALRLSASRADVVEVLLEAGAPVNVVDQWGNTPLWRAVFNAQGDPRITQRLVQAGADPDRAYVSGVTPRQLAMTIANYDTTEYFPETK